MVSSANECNVVSKRKRRPQHLSKQALSVRRWDALELRKQYLSYREIAKAQGIDAGVAFRDVQIVMKEYAANMKDSIKTVRDREEMSLDAIEKQLHVDLDIEGLDVYDRMRIYDRILKVKKRRADLLGLDAPKKHVVQVEDARAMMMVYNNVVVNIIAKSVPDSARDSIVAELGRAMSNASSRMKTCLPEQST